MSLLSGLFIGCGLALIAGIDPGDVMIWGFIIWLIFV
jgi:hypothetical protein